MRSVNIEKLKEVMSKSFPVTSFFLGYNDKTFKKNFMIFKDCLSSGETTYEQQ